MGRFSPSYSSIHPFLLPARCARCSAAPQGEPGFGTLCSLQMVARAQLQCVRKMSRAPDDPAAGPASEHQELEDDEGISLNLRRRNNVLPSVAGCSLHWNEMTVCEATLRLADGAGTGDGAVARGPGWRPLHLRPLGNVSPFDADVPSRLNSFAFCRSHSLRFPSAPLAISASVKPCPLSGCKVAS